MPKTILPFVDPLGAVVLAAVSDPVTAIALKSPSVGERPPAPEEQLFGPPGEEAVDFLYGGD